MLLTNDTRDNIVGLLIKTDFDIEAFEALIKYIDENGKLKDLIMDSALILKSLDYFGLAKL